MTSVRMQILQAVEAKLDLIRLELDWTKLVINPREPIGEDELNALIVLHGGDAEPLGLTGHVAESRVELSVGMMVLERGGETAELLLDAGFVAISNALCDPQDIQLGGLAIGIDRLGISEPTIGRTAEGGRIMAGQAIDFAVRYLEREGDAETPGP